MVGIRDMRATLRLISVFFMLALAPAWAVAADTAQEQAQRQQEQPLNNAPVWRDVRGGENPFQTTQVRGVETNILIQSEGQIWREIRNGPVTVYGGWLFVLALVGAALFYFWKGPIKLHGQPTGRMIERFTPWERLLHWTTAIAFVILSLSGLIILF